jgi:hypothetical protein
MVDPSLDPQLVRAFYRAAMFLKARIDHDGDARAIRMRAIRRLGQMMEEQPKAKPGGDMKSDHRVFKKPNDFPTLAEQGMH